MLQHCKPRRQSAYFSHAIKILVSKKDLAALKRTQLESSSIQEDKGRPHVIPKQDYIVFSGPPKTQETSRKHEGISRPLTAGRLQAETHDTLAMYGADQKHFTPLAEQLSLFPDTPRNTVAKITPLALDDPSLDIPHQSSFRFLAKEATQQIRPAVFYEKVALQSLNHEEDAVSLTQGKLLVEGVTELKADQFPQRVSFIHGGLYPEKAQASNQDPHVIARHRNAPNFRKMDNKPIYGVGQPTKQGFQDVFNHLKAQNKPVVWTNTRSEAVIYISGEPYNLREVASMQNLPLKDEATGEEVEALELQLKERLKEQAAAQGGKIRLPVESLDSRSPSYQEVAVNPNEVQTTREVIEELQGPPHHFQIEYRRIPLADEKSPTPAQIDELRRWTNEVQDRHPKDNSKLSYVFNCHQGRGRTTTGMVVAGMALDGNDGKTRQLELPLWGDEKLTLGEGTKERANRVINEAFHMQNLRDTVEQTQAKVDKKASEAANFESMALLESDPTKKAQLKDKAHLARSAQKKYEQNVRDFTRRYTMMQKYSEYLGKHGAHATTPTFDEWMKEPSQTADYEKRWVKLAQEFHLNPEGVVLA